MTTGSESVDAIMRGRRMVLFAGFVVRMEDTRLPNCVMFGRLMGGAGCLGGQEKEWTGCLLEPGSALSGGYAPDSAKAECSSIVDEPG